MGLQNEKQPRALNTLGCLTNIVLGFQVKAILP